MHRRMIAIAMASMLSLSAAGTLHAAPFFHHTATDKQAKSKLISFNLRNDSKETLVLKSGDQQYTVEPGKSSAFKLEEGAEIMNVNATAHLAPGALVTKVTKELQGNTLAIS